MKINETIIASGNEIAETVASRAGAIHERIVDSGTRIADRIVEQGNTHPPAHRRIRAAPSPTRSRRRGASIHERILSSQPRDRRHHRGPRHRHLRFDRRGDAACRRRHREPRHLDPSEDPRLRPRRRQRHREPRRLDPREDHHLRHRGRRRDREPRHRHLRARSSKSGTRFGEVIAVHSHELGEGLDERFRRIAELVGERGPALITALGEQAHSMETVARHASSPISATPSAPRSTTVSESLESNSHRIAEALDHRSRQINQTLIERTREIAETFTSGQTEFAALIDGRLIEVGGQLAGAHRTSSPRRCRDRANAITAALAGKTDEVAEGVRARDRRGHPAAGQPNRATRPGRCAPPPSEASTVLGRAINEIEGMLGARANAVTEALEQRTREFNDVLGARCGELAALLDGRSNVAPAHARPARQRHRRDGGHPQRRGRPHAHRERRARRRDLRRRPTTRCAPTSPTSSSGSARSNELLNGLLARHSENLDKIETNLAARSDEFGSAIDHAVESDAALVERARPTRSPSSRDVSREILDGVSNVVKRFEAQSHVADRGDPAPHRGQPPDRDDGRGTPAGARKPRRRPQARAAKSSTA